MLLVLLVSTMVNVPLAQGVKSLRLEDFLVLLQLLTAKLWMLQIRQNAHYAILGLLLIQRINNALTVLLFPLVLLAIIMYLQFNQFHALLALEE